MAISTSKSEKNVISDLLCNQSNIVHIAIIGLLLANLVVGLIGLQQNDTVGAIKKIEAMKVGGEENYEKLEMLMTSEAYKERQKENIDMAIMQMEQANKTVETSGSEQISNEEPQITPSTSNQPEETRGDE